MSKEMWFAEMEQRMAELIDQGVPEDEAYDRASNDAHERLRDRLADIADMERKRDR
jgi:hypothetical protein